MVGLRLDLFGGFSLRKAGGGDQCAFATTKSKALLAWLALAPGRAHRREALAALLWGERPERAARHSLSQALLSLKKTLAAAGVSAINADHRQAKLTPGVIVVDVARFEALMSEGTPAALNEAAGLHRGEFLAGFDGIGEVFDEWLEARRFRQREAYWNCLARLLDHHSNAGPPERAIAHAQRLLELEPLDEPVHRRLMSLYLKQGRKTAALRQFAVCASILARELGVEPEAKTKALHRSIGPPAAAVASPRATPSLAGSRASIAGLPMSAGGPEPGQD